MKYALITGATSGIGLAVCKELLKQDFKVIGVGRNAETNEQVKKELEKEFDSDRFVFMECDLSIQSEVRRLGEDVKKYLEKESEGKLDVLINNAGCVRSYYMTTRDGIETQFAVNHLAGFILTNLLLLYVIKAKGRIIFTSSGSHLRTKIKWKDIMFKKHYSTLFMYKQTKLCNMLTAWEINKRFSKFGIRAYGVDPGLVNTNIGIKNTSGIVRFVWNLRKNKGVDPLIPAQTYKYLCLEKEHPSEFYYYLSKPAKYNKEVNDQNADRLWDLSTQYTGIEINSKGEVIK